MAVAYASSSSVAEATAANATYTAPTGIADGDLLIISHYMFSSTTGAPPTATPPAGFLPVPGATWPLLVTTTLSAAHKYLWYKFASGESGNYTVTHVSNVRRGVMVRVSGADPTNPFSPAPTQNTGTNSNTYTFTGVTTTADGELILVIGSDWNDTANNLTAPTGTTPTFTERVDIAGEYLATGNLSPAGATGNKTMTNNSNVNVGSGWLALMVAVQAATGVAPQIDLLSPAALSGPDAPPGFFESTLLPVSSADVLTPVADADTGTGSETSDVQATVPGAETSTGTDTGTVSATASDSDSGTESDAGTLAASVPGSDSATGTDTGVSSTTGTGSDTGTGSEAGTASVTLAGADSGTGTDAQVSIVSPVAGSDSAAGSETGSVSATVPGSDTSTGTDTGTASVTAAGTDSGTGTEAQVVTETGPGGEAGAGTEAGTVSVTAPGSDSSTGSEAATASVTASGTDSGTGTDAGSVADITGGATPISGSDSGVGTETGVVVDLTVPVPDTGGGRDVDFGDETSIYGEPPRHLNDTDFAVSIEHGEVVNLTPAPKPRIRIRLPRRRAPEPVDVFRALSDGDGAVGTEEQAHFATVAAVDAGRGVEDAGDMQDFSEGAAEEMQVLALLGVL